MSEKHTILEGKVHVYRRNGSPIWQCSTYLKGKNWRVTTKEESLSKAKDWPEDWYFDLKDKGRRDELLGEKTFKDAADQFITEYEVLTEGERNARWVQDYYRRVRMYLVPFFRQEWPVDHQCRNRGGIPYFPADTGARQEASLTQHVAS